jgi:hypothetical protein
MKKLIYALLYINVKPENLQMLLDEMKGIANTSLMHLSFNEITAVVSDINSGSVITDKSTAMEYASVIEILSQHYTLIPMRYGSLLDSSDAVINMLERNCIDIQHNLLKVANKHEFGLKIFCEPEKLREELQAKSEADRKMSANPAPETTHSVFLDYMNEKLKEHRLEELYINYVDFIIAEISQYLIQMNATCKFKKMGSAVNIIDAVFLLEKERKCELIQTVQTLQKQHNELNFVLTGPWSPYNFAEITIK